MIPKKIKLTQEIDLENYTVIIPSVGVGNVGQLAVDLIISNLNLPKVGQILNCAFIPVVGANAYDERSSEISTTIDIYAGRKERILVIQIRSLDIDVPTSGFFYDLKDFVEKNKMDKVIILGSCYDFIKTCIPRVRLQYFASSGINSKYGELFSQLKWTLYPWRSPERLFLPGNGFGIQLFNYLAMDIDCAVLFTLCSEGDNREDAVALVQYLNQWIHIFEESSIDNLKYPPSWKLLFGKPPSQNIY